MWNVCYTTRREKLLKCLADRELPALLVSNPCNVTYLSGFSGHDSYLLVSPSRTVLFSDTRYATQIRDECPGLQVEIRDAKSTMTKELSRLLPQFGLKFVGIEGDHLTYDQFTRLSEEMAGITLIPQTSMVETLRQIKDESEIAEIRKAVEQAQRGFELVKASLLLDQTELQVAFDLEHGMRRFGAYRAAFEPIIAAGARAALPHARATSQRLSGACEVLFDWGSQTLRGYRSDLTRVGVIGKLSPELDAVYRLVLKAQQTAIGLIRPGMLCREIDSAARRVIDEGGYGAFFGHGLGHGIGLEVHEGPRLSPVSQEILQPGMIVTVEPGIYLPDVGGVRLEDDVLVTPDGYEILSDLPKDVETVLLHG